MTAAVVSADQVPARAEDKLLSETVDFTGTVLFLETGVPGLVIGATRDGKFAVSGFGETSKGSGKTPDGDTLMRIGSVTKVFTGAVLASLVADGTVGLADPLRDHLKWDTPVPERDGHVIRLIELATYTSGLPREVEREQGPPDDPFSTLTAEAYAKALGEDPLLFTPGTGGLYSNFAFDVLSAALSGAAGKPYPDILKERVLGPAGLQDTVLTLRDGDRERLMQGHNFDGSPLPDVRTTPIMAGASALYSTANDTLKWLDWHSRRN
jgi:D-alanyl-D-alanine-carboxypeptidase/D-alanyl-D-alanine-endopeptidase